MIYTSPFLSTPLTDFSFLLAPNFRHLPNTTICSKLEKKFLDCLEAYGASRAREKCADLIYDMIECNNSTFQKHRSQAIRLERMKQYRAGKLKRPFEEYPPLDSFLFV